MNLKERLITGSAQELKTEVTGTMKAPYSHIPHAPHVNPFRIFCTFRQKCCYKQFSFSFWGIPLLVAQVMGSPTFSGVQLARAHTNSLLCTP